MGILKCLSWFEMNTHIKGCFSFESFPFVDVGVQECCFLIGNFSRKFDRRLMIVCLFNEMFYSVSVCSPEREDVVYVTFPNERTTVTIGTFWLYLNRYCRKVKEVLAPPSIRYYKHRFHFSVSESLSHVPNPIFPELKNAILSSYFTHIRVL